MPRDKKTGIVTPPKDQSFAGGFSITMMAYNSANVPQGIVTARFQYANELSDFYNQNKFRQKKKKKAGAAKGGKNKTSKP